VIEAPYFNLPAVNIGHRQRNRERGANMIDSGIGREEIRAALKTAVSPEFRKQVERSPKLFGDGTASKKIVEILRNAPTGPALFQKKPLQIEKMEEIVR
jgi:UDP-N-acetylglucosamine 2-epimerase